MGLSLVVLLVGCADANPLGREALEGKVTLDGQPLKAGSVLFEPIAPGGVGSGTVITDGMFSISESKGLPPGEYRVRLHAADQGAAPAPDPENDPGSAGLAPPDLIPAEWNVRSEHTVKVTENGENQFTFAIGESPD